MNRITTSAWNEPIRRALNLFSFEIPTDVFVGDAVFAGLHSFRDTGDGRSYKDTSHTCYPWHIDGPADRRRTTIVFAPGSSPSVAVAVHELAHVVDYEYGFDFDASPVSRYAERDRHEAFAEAVTSLLLPGYADPVDPDDYLWLRALVA